MKIKYDIFYRETIITISFDNYYKDLDKWIIKNNIKTIYLQYVTQGNWKKIYKKIINKYANINFIKFNRDYDVNSWIYSKKGYFKFKQNIPKIIRNNCSYMILLKLSGHREVNMILKDFGLGVSKEQLLQMYQYSTNEKFSPLILDLEQEPDNRFRKGFQEILDPKIF